MRRIGPGLVFALVVLCLGTLAAESADWPQWRGPDRNGLAPGGPALADAWPAAGPAKLWQSEKLPAVGGAGYGCLALADNRVFLYVDWGYSVPIDTRTLTADAVKRLGWLSPRPPEALLKLIEDARVSDEREPLKGKDIQEWAKKWLDTNINNPRVLTTAALKQFGWPAEKPAEKLMKAVEDARVSDGAAKLRGKAVQDWAKKWVDTNVTDEKEKEQFGAWAVARIAEGKNALAFDLLDKLAAVKDKEFATQAELDKCLDENAILDPARARVLLAVQAALKEKQRFAAWAGQRLNEGKTAPALDVLDTLATIKDKEFPTQAELDKWLDEHAITDPLRKSVIRLVPVQKPMAHDAVVCLNAADGKQLWKSEFPGQPGGNGASSTPCVVNGRCYVIGADADAYCLDVKDGAKVWSAKVGKGGKRYCSFIVVDGAAIIPAGPLTAFDAEKGTELWKQEKIGNVNSSPAVWEKDGKKLVIVNAGAKVFAVEPKTGAIAWEVAGPHGMSTPVISGDRMVLVGDNKNAGLTAYKLAPDKAEKLWNVATFFDPASSAIIDGGIVYATSGSKDGSNVIRVELETGKVAWDKKLGVTGYSSPVLADGKLFAAAGAAIMMLKPTADDCTVLGQAKVGMGSCNSPAVADGKLYLRLGGAIACYGLTKAPEPAPAKP